MDNQHPENLMLGYFKDVVRLIGGRRGLHRLLDVLTRRTTERPRPGTIESTSGVCGGSARVAGTRIPVWVLVEARDLGVSEAQLLIDYPSLTASNLVDAWDYASRHRDEIASAIHRNEVA